MAELRNGRVLTAKGSVLTNKLGLAAGKAGAIARLDIDGQNGLSYDYRTLNANTPYIRKNVYCFVLEVPLFFKYIGNDNGVSMTRAFKSLMENKSEKISGLDSGLQAEYVQVNIGPSETFDAFSRTVRNKSEPQHTWTSLYGRSIELFLETWLVMGMADPITGIPGVVTTEAYLREHPRNRVNGHDIYTLMPENIAATCIYIEPDPTHTFAVNAWLCTNMMPDNAGESVGERDLTSSPDKVEVSVKFTCVQEANSGVKVLANNILQAMEIRGLGSVDRRAYLGDTYESIIAAGERPAATPGDANNPDTGIIHQNREMASTEHVLKMSTNYAQDADIKQKSSYMGVNVS